MCRRLGELPGLKGDLDLSEEGIKNPRHVSTEQRGDQVPALSPEDHGPHRPTIFLSPPFSNLDPTPSPALYSSLWR